MFTKIFQVVRKNPELGVSFRRKILGLSQLEGGFNALMIGCAETFALYYAVKRGLSKQDFALISTLPIVFGALANWAIPRLVESRYLKRSLLAVVFIQILGVLGLYFSVNASNHFWWILISLSLYWIGGMSATHLWIDWISGWLPADRMNRYLSRRNGFTAFVTVIGYLLAAYWVHLDERISSYQFVFGLALLSRMMSWLILSYQATPQNPKIEKSKPFKLSEALKSKSILIMISFTILFRFVAYMASPFFLPYMVDELHFTLMDYAWISAVPFIAKALLLAQWGEAVRSYRPFIGLQTAMILLGLVSLAWTFTTHMGLLTIIEVFSGISWGGFELGGILILYNFAPRRSRSLIGFYLALLHTSGLLGSLVGSHLLESGWTSVELFRFSGVTRLTVAFLFVIVGLQVEEMKVGLRVYGEFFVTALSLRGSLVSLGRIFPVVHRSKKRN
ncbi:MAG: hypothetical protein JWQ35_1570 [Bacteriovoracaceae bacterium]|nr:hypothetical protein [Bacteriovoracaceae bacterium]